MRKKNTAELFYKSFAISILIGAGIAGALYTLIALIFSSDLLLSFQILLIAFVPLILLAACYYIQHLYYRRVELTNIQTVELKRTSSSPRFIGFVVMVNVNGFNRFVTTKKVFTSGRSFRIPFNDLDYYLGKTAEVGYNAKRDEYIVLALND